MTHDILYGPCCEPAYMQEVEKYYSPQSLTRLSRDNALLIRSYLKVATDGLRVPQVLHGITNLLWLVDEGGDIWVAVEEMINPITGQTSVYLRSGSQPLGFEKLGHPSLIEGESKQARVGGEIVWDGRIKNVRSPWLLINKSGRYGGKLDQREHIRQVAKRFEEHDIILTPMVFDATTGKVVAI